MKVRAFGIKYDTDGQKVKLPKTLVIDIDEDVEEDELDMLIADYISDITGWCVLECDYEVVE